MIYYSINIIIACRFVLGNLIWAILFYIRILRHTKNMQTIRIAIGHCEKSDMRGCDQISPMTWTGEYGRDTNQNRFWKTCPKRYVVR